MYVNERAGEIAEGAAADFAAFFAGAWSVGATDAERFFALVGARMTPDTRLVQPLARPVRGPDGMRRLFTPLFVAMPDLRSDVHRFGATEDGVLIEHTLSGTLGGKRISWPVVDRFVLRDGKFLERRAFFDSLPLLAAMATRPRASLDLGIAMLKRKESP